MKLTQLNKTIEQKVIKFIDENQLVKSGDRILVALSGGADSVFLLNFLNKYKKKYDIELFAFHLNHKLRKESDSDQEFSKNLCKKLSIPFFTAGKKVRLYAKKKKLSIEEAGRILRYEMLQKKARKLSCNKIATAHNLDDNSETILLNLIKGRGLSAIAGIPIKSNNVIRPIMCLSKSEIESYLKINNIEFVVDRSNQDENFERNYLRNKIVPLITEKFNKNFSRNIFQTTNILNQYLEFTDKIISSKYSQVVRASENNVEVSLTLLTNESEFLLAEIIRRIIIQEFNHEATYKTIRDIVSLTKKQAGRRKNISDDIVVFKEADKLVFMKNKKSNPVIRIVPTGKTFYVNKMKISIKKTKDFYLGQGSKIEYIDADKVVGNLVLRNWNEGDKFIPLGMKGYKKVSDFLTDIKIPSSKRDEILILEDQQKIICILGHRIDDRVKITEQTKNTYKIEISNGV
jgi:tRNA(Ile)-lysidine synthase